MATDVSANASASQRESAQSSGSRPHALQVQIVSVEQELWSGEASMVVARTTEGELGVQPGHTPLLGRLDGVVRIHRTDGDDLVVAPHGAFISVTDEAVSILAETAEFADDIDVARAEAALERARSAADSDDEEKSQAEARAIVRLRATGRDV